MMLASFLTNAALAGVAVRYNYNNRFFDMSDIVKWKDVANEYKLMISTKTDEPQALDKHNTLVRQLHHPWMAIRLCQQDICQPPQSNVEKPSAWLAPLNHWPPASSQHQKTDLRIFQRLVQSIKNSPYQRVENLTPYDLVMGFHPFSLPPNLDKRLRPVSISAVFMLRVVLESYKSWQNIPGDLPFKPFNHRIHVLTFAQHIHKSVERFLSSDSFRPRSGCDCTDCQGPIALLDQTQSFSRDLVAFTRERCFDLYHQSPVVAGYQASRILARATNIGTLLCNRSQYVGIVLHMYNLLRQFHVIDTESVLLDNLCEVINHNIFRGPRPTRKFFSQYAAFSGAALEFDKKTRTHSMAIGSVLKRHLHPHRLSAFNGLNDCACKPRCNCWAPVWYGINAHHDISNKGVDKTAAQINSHPVVCVLEPLETVVRPQWQGTFPIGKINWFEIFMTCTEILEKISSVRCGDLRDLTAEDLHVHKDRDTAFSCGKSLVERMFEIADTYEGKVKTNFVADYWHELTPMKNAIHQSLKGWTFCWPQDQSSLAKL